MSVPPIVKEMQTGNTNNHISLHIGENMAVPPVVKEM
jgi:hypothetical protein